METADTFSIIQITDPKKIAICTGMMQTSDPWTTYQMDYAHCLKAFDGPSKEIYVLEDKDGIVGFVILQISGTFKGYVQTICVSEFHRGKGLGKKMLQFCEDRILKISPNIFICVSSFNDRAIKLYHEFGFKLVGELKDFLKQGYTELLFRKTFGPILG
ncbi:MAG: GNAT family N-acetyltransferase [Chitinophagales bacterium]